MAGSEPGAGSLDRLLNPASVAVVGVSERRPMSNVAVGHLLAAPVELHLVSPRPGVAYGRSTVASLRAVGGPVDAVFSLVGAAGSVGVVEEAAQLGCGGVVVVASGFAEAGDEGRERQDRLARAAAGAALPVCGPNCTGLVNVTSGVSLFTGTAVAVPAGGVSLVSSSGYLMRAAMAAARERNLGLRLAVSAGNEAVTVLADYLDFLVADPLTRVITVVIEKLRDPASFFAAVERARAAGKPVVVLKLGRSERARAIVRSHTGALTGESWVYDLAFRAAGVVDARDVDDLMDRAAILAQLPAHRLRPVERIAVIASSGGVAALASDVLAADVRAADVRASDVRAGEEVETPELTEIADEVRAIIPGAEVVNPLDLTGFTMARRESLDDVLRIYLAAEALDAVVVTWWLDEEDRERAEVLLGPAREAARRAGKPVVLTTVQQSRLGSWTATAGGPGLAFARGLGGAVRGLAAITRHLSPQPRVRPAAPPRPIPPPRPADVVRGDAGAMLSFAATMTLLAERGLPVAPWVVLDDPADWPARAGDLGGGAQLVVKLADVAHRTELGAVRLGVASGKVTAVAAELQAIAAAHGVPRTVAVQSQLAGAGEAFVGYQARTDLGPVVVAGLGGILVELTRTVVGRLLPVDGAVVESMLDELGGATVFRGLRAGAGWDRSALAKAVLAVAELGVAGAGWIGSIDVNPLICSPSGCVVADALVLVERTDAAAGTVTPPPGTAATER
ncbi:MULTISPECIES: acetate--CoA ligase family protein [Frankia]|nr:MULTISPECIES: acetate--CoA ligase family protein [Frankia]